MPETSSSTLRKGVADGQEPVQMPHAVQRSGSTCAWRMPLRYECSTIVIASYGQSWKHHVHPLQLSGLTAAAAAAVCFDGESHGRATSTPVMPASSTHTYSGSVRSSSG